MTKTKAGGLRDAHPTCNNRTGPRVEPLGALPSSFRQPLPPRSCKATVPRANFKTHLLSGRTPCPSAAPGFLSEAEEVEISKKGAWALWPSSALGKDAALVSLENELSERLAVWTPPGLESSDSHSRVSTSQMLLEL